jgi:hypothetical protein
MDDDDTQGSQDNQDTSTDIHLFIGRREVANDATQWYQNIIRNNVPAYFTRDHDRDHRRDIVTDILSEMDRHGYRFRWSHDIRSINEERVRQSFYYVLYNEEQQGIIIDRGIATRDQIDQWIEDNPLTDIDSAIVTPAQINGWANNPINLDPTIASHHLDEIGQNLPNYFGDDNDDSRRDIERSVTRRDEGIRRKTVKTSLGQENKKKNDNDDGGDDDGDGNGNGNGNSNEQNNNDNGNDGQEDQESSYDNSNKQNNDGGDDDNDVNDNDGQEDQSSMHEENNFINDVNDNDGNLSMEEGDYFELDGFNRLIQSFNQQENSLKHDISRTLDSDIRRHKINSYNHGMNSRTREMVSIIQKMESRIQEMQKNHKQEKISLMESIIRHIQESIRLSSMHKMIRFTQRKISRTKKSISDMQERDVESRLNDEEDHNDVLGEDQCRNCWYRIFNIFPTGSFETFSTMESH